MQLLLRPFHNPPLQTYGEFVTFFSHICEVSPAGSRLKSGRCLMTTIGCPIYAREHVAHWYVVITLIFLFLIWPTARDCTYGNIMLDPSNMFPESFHLTVIDRSKDFRHKAKWYSRTRRPTRYLLIDFGLSRRYDPANGSPLEKPLRGGDKSAPEHQDRVTPCNPFPTDVYYLGNLVREYYIQVYAFPSLNTSRLQINPEMPRI